MQTPTVLRRSLSARLCKPLRWLGLCGVLAILSACGGGSESAPEVAAPLVPGAGVTSFRLVPARLVLTTGDAGTLLAQQAPGALVWSSSDPAVAGVDAQGQVTALAAGSTVISATSGTTVVSSTVKVYAVAAPTPTALIAAALAANRISAEQALTYRVFALFGDTRLPAEFEGAPEGAPDHMLMRRVSASLPTLSQATKDILSSFLLPPIYAQSWYAQQLGLPAAAAAGIHAHAAAMKNRHATTTINCDAVTQAAYWQRLSTAHFNIFYLALPFAGSDPYNVQKRQAAEMVAAVVEEVYRAETGLLQRYPLPDTTENCNGGDGALDIYLTELGSADLAGLTQTYPDRCSNVPSFIAMNANHSTMGLVASGRPEARSEVKAVVAHEFAHVLQFAMDRTGGSCEDYEWLDEASAEWIMDFVDPALNREDGYLKVADNRRRTGSFFGQYLFSDHMAAIEKPGRLGDPKKNGYADYLFFQYLARKYDPQTIKQVFDASVAMASVEAVEAALASKGGMKAVWPEFALTLWNDSSNQVLDDFSRWDSYDFGLAPVFERSVAIGFKYPEAERLKTIEVDQKGQPRATFKLLKNALELPGEFPTDNYEIQPRSLFYEHLKFSDATVHSVYLSNPVASFPNREFMKVQAISKIGGQWKPVEDWTADAFKQFCLDRKDERLEELLIVVSNSEVNRGAETPFKIPRFFPMQISTSNVGCWKWQGTASTTFTGGSPTSIDSIARGTVTLEVADVLPGRLIFETTSGVINGSSTAVTGQCTTTSVGADLTAVKGAADGTIDVNLDLDIGFSEIGGEPPDRKFLKLLGSSLLSTTNRMVCPSVDVSSVGPQSWEWLHVDEPSAYTVSADGQVIEGRFTSPLPTGATITSVWRFTAVRE